MFIKNARVSLALGDITRQDTDAIVNSADPALAGGGGVDGAIHRVGGVEIAKECRQIVVKQGMLPRGKAVITTGGKLKARYVIHTVGPIWTGGKKGEPEILASAYRESLKVAAANNLTSVSFPSIGTGAYGYPQDKAAKVALRAVVSFLKEKTTSLREIIFVLYDSQTYQSYRSALEELGEEKP